MRHIASICLVFVALALAVPASADSISDMLVITNANGAVVASISATEAQEASNGSGATYVIPNSSLIDPSMFGNFTQVLGPDGISDVFGITQGDPACPQTSCLAFASDTETASVPFTGAPNTVLEGSGGSFDATSYLAPDLQANGWHATFISDADAVSVPEPPALILLVAGLTAMLLLIRKIAY
jgi:hypothetical protein